MCGIKSAIVLGSSGLDFGAEFKCERTLGVLNCWELGMCRYVTRQVCWIIGSFPGAWLVCSGECRNDLGRYFNVSHLRLLQH